MHSWMRLVTAVALLSLPLAGCLSDTPTEEPVGTFQRDAPTVTDRTGAIDGILTDNAVQPIKGASIELVESVRFTTSFGDGSFSFPDVPPGTYTLIVRADGFVSAGSEVVVKAGQIVNVDFILVHLVSDEAYSQHVEFAGLMACGFAGGWNVSTLPEPPSPVPDLRASDIAWTICEDVDFASDDATADQTYWEFDLDSPLHTLVVEVVWDSQGKPLMTELQAIGGFAVNGDQVARWKYRAIDVAGESPLLPRIDRPRLQEIQAEFVARCAGGEPDMCGHDFFADGWPTGLAVLPNGHCVQDQVSVCGGVQETFTVYISSFYNAPGPGGFSVRA